jgi:putative aldouronate transport system permease protein
MAIMTKGEKAFQIFNYVFLLGFSLLTMYPFLNMLAISFSGRASVARGLVGLIPKEVQLRSYTYMLENEAYWKAFGFTVFLTLVFIVISVSFTCIIAYPISKKDFKLKNPMTVMIIITMFFSGGLIPEFLLYRSLGIYDTIWVLLIPGAVSTWSLLIVRNFFMGIPDSIEESALIDGANEFQILFRIVIPMSMALIATITLWYAVSEWNTFAQVIYFTDREELRSLQVVLRSIIRDSEGITGLSASTETNISQGNLALTPQSVKAVAIVLTTLPIMLVYPFLQKYFVKGVIVGSLKG